MAEMIGNYGDSTTPGTALTADSHPARTSKDASGNTVLMGADGVDIPLTRVYTTTLTLSGDTAALASGTVIPLDLALIDDLGMADATVIGRINIPSYIKKIRVTARASYKYDAATAGTYRSCVISAAPSTNAPSIRAQPFPSVGAATMAPTSTAVSGLIDVAGLGWDISAGTAFIQMTASHDGNAAPPILPAASKSFLTVEMYV